MYTLLTLTHPQASDVIIGFDQSRNQPLRTKIDDHSVEECACAATSNALKKHWRVENDGVDALPQAQHQLSAIIDHSSINKNVHIAVIWDALGPTVAHIELLEDHEDAGNDELWPVLPLQDVQVGALDQVGLPSSLHNVLKLNVYILHTAAPFQDLQR